VAHTGQETGLRVVGDIEREGRLAKLFGQGGARFDVLRQQSVLAFQLKVELSSLQQVADAEQDLDLVQGLDNHVTGTD
jgi:hypothetical protein